jgi:hypothetical protein
VALQDMGDAVAVCLELVRCWSERGGDYRGPR